MAWLSGWSYKKAIVVDQTDDIGAVNYQMKLLVGESSGATGEQVDCGGHCLSTFNDLRFTQSDGSTTLDYWIESLSGVTPNQLATVWVEVPVLDDAADTTIYMYYGNAGASAASNGANTFLFFDNFPGVAIDTDKWAGDTTLAAVASNIMTFTVPDNTRWYSMYSKVSVANNVRSRQLVALENKDYSTISLAEAAVSATNEFNVGKGLGTSTWQTLIATPPYATSVSTQAITGDQYYIIDMCRLLTGTDTARFFSDGVQVGSDCTTTIWTSAATVRPRVIYTGTYMKMKWCFLSNYTYTEPTWKSFGAEECPLPHFAYYPHILAH